MNRRTFLKSFGAGIALGGTAGIFLEACKSTTDPGMTGGVRGMQPLRIPATNLGSGNLTAAMGSADMWKGLPSNVITINGSFLGPTISIRKGNTLNIGFTNGLSEMSSIHWHGLQVPSVMDGHPKDAIAAGKNYTYTFPIVDRAGTYWYHAHPDGLTGKQAYLGLAGLLLVSDDEEDALNLPSREYDIPLVLQDKRLDTNNAILWNKTSDDVPSGFLGDNVFVNGTPDAYHGVKKALYRLRFVNASNARIYNVGFEDGHPMQLIANDGGLLDKPYEMTAVMIAPGERIDVLVDFSNYQLGHSVKLQSLAFTFGGHDNENYPQGKVLDLVRFDVNVSGTNSYAMPSALTNYEKLDPAKAVSTRYVQLTMDHTKPYGQHMIDGKTWDPNQMDRVDYQMKAGDLEIWEIENQGPAAHSMHFHGTQFQVLERVGKTLRPNDLGWKDTVYFEPDDFVRLLVRYNTYKGLYLFHCHNLEHEDDGMMLNIEVS
jgi:FtsP/CotA-like multicopper oxidase with cupredoxin domain